MSIITGSKIKTEDGQDVKADAFGNNIAIICPNCKSFPILLIARANQKGSDLQHSTHCNNCGKSYYIISNLNEKELKEIILKVS
ncbi:MAG: hypothetical protein OQJ93_07185 [Ignavibacteriaceae bacterium]|jgi:hypothetical protein|nr:hypothetical protein [Ignavibacteriaceae bacterium]MCW9097156.1 hypothetical protein [Ignavibacteriaceae bacterium]